MYGTFEINPGKLRGVSGEYNSMARELDKIAERLENQKNGLDSGSYGNVKEALGALIAEVKGHSRGMINMKNGLEGSIRLYEEAEAGIVQTKADHHKPEADSAAGNQEEEKDAGKEKLLELLYTFLDGASFIPSSAVPYLQMLLSGITGEEIDATIIASILESSLNKYAFFFNVAENGWKEGLKKGFGLNVYMPKGTVPGKSFAEYFKAAMKSELDGFVDISSAAKTAESVAKWGGVGLTGILEGVENYEEYKAGGISAGRAVAETVIETTADVGIGMAATAAMGACLATAGAVAAPAVVVAGAAAVVVVGVNSFVEYVSGKDVGEWAADIACDIGESVGGWFQSLWD